MTSQPSPQPTHGSRRQFGHLPPFVLLAALISAFIPSIASAQSGASEQSNAGPLDTPLPDAIVNKNSRAADQRPARAPSRAPSGGRGAASLKSAVREEQDTLERLPRPALNARALRNERAAQIALGVSFAREAALLGFSVAAANSAASDAVRWYNKAASQGFPGAPSLDIAGIRHYPVRASRTPLE